MKVRRKSGRILVPATSPGDWQRFLAEPDRHWKAGRSARTLAHSWHDGDGMPPEIETALKSAFSGVQLLLAVPEWRVPLPGGARPSQSDVWALCRTETGLVSVAVEGKVDEPFGPTIGDWLKHSTPGRWERLAFLRERLGLPSPPPHSIRYQLLHRTVSAIVEAERFHAAHAVMMVHSFHPEDRWFDDFSAFAGALGTIVEQNRLHPVQTAAACTLHLGWIHGDERFLIA
jgi:hypothetical protein